MQRDYYKIVEIANKKDALTRPSLNTGYALFLSLALHCPDNDPCESAKHAKCWQIRNQCE